MLFACFQEFKERRRPVSRQLSASSLLFLGWPGWAVAICEHCVSCVLSIATGSVDQVHQVLWNAAHPKDSRQSDRMTRWCAEVENSVGTRLRASRFERVQAAGVQTGFANFVHLNLGAGEPLG